MNCDLELRFLTAYSSLGSLGQSSKVTRAEPCPSGSRMTANTIVNARRLWHMSLNILQGLQSANMPSCLEWNHLGFVWAAFIYFFKTLRVCIFKMELKIIPPYITALYKLMVPPECCQLLCLGVGPEVWPLALGGSCHGLLLLLHLSSPVPLQRGTDFLFQSC